MWVYQRDEPAALLMKALSLDLLGVSKFSFSERSRERWKPQRRGFASIFFLLFAMGFWPLFPSAGTWAADFSPSPKGDEVLSERSPIRDVTVPVEKVSESPFRQSDLAAERRSQAAEAGELPYFEHAISLEEAQEWRRLLELSQKWTGAYPKEGAAWFFVGIAYEKLGRYHEAIRAYREAIRRKENFSKAWCNLGTCYAYLGQYSEAVDAFKRAVRQKEDFGRAWSDLGAADVELGHYSEAVRALEKAVQLRPNLPEAWCNLGTAYAELKHYDQAISATRKAVRLKPDYGDAWYNLATLYKATGRQEEMAEARRKVQELDPALGKELSKKLASP